MARKAYWPTPAEIEAWKAARQCSRPSASKWAAARPTEDLINDPGWSSRSVNATTPAA